MSVRPVLALLLLATACGPTTPPEAGPTASASGVGANGSGSGSSGESEGTSSASSSSNGGASGTSSSSSETSSDSSSASSSSSSASSGSSGTSSSSSATSSSSSGTSSSSSGSTGCSPSTRITYGDAWIHGANHPGDVDTTSAHVTWDASCPHSGSNEVATLSNGWAPYFSGQAGCVMALDATCPDDTGCTTRIGYGPAWIPAPNHPNFYDDVAGRVFWERGNCTNTGGNSYARLSNGWTPTFSGNNACDVSFRYTGCGGLYANSILDACADPGVLLDGSTYVLTCTSGNAANAFPIRTSTDLVSWTSHGSIFPSGHHPSWAASDFWAPEIHKVGSHYVAYFTARGSDGVLAVGAATASAATGPFTDLGHALVHDASMGMIDPTEFTAADGTPYLVWKADGNAVGQHTPIYGQQLTADGTALTGTRHTLITNDEGWEGGVVEGPWVVLHDGSYFLFYSGNSYANATYAVGVAKASSPLGTYSKLGSPILTSDTPWKGPGHCSVVSAPSGDTVMVYHAWQAGHVNGAGDSRHLLIDPVQWSGGWPSMPAAPSSTSRPLP